MLSKPFTFIFALVVIALILLFGIMAITRLFSFGCAVEAEKFVMDFDNKVEVMDTLAKGSRAQYSLIVPPGVAGICFIDTTSTNNIDTSKLIYPDVKQKVELLIGDGMAMKENMFIAADANADKDCLFDRKRINGLRVADNIQCFDTKFGEFKFVLENMGKYVQISGA